MSLLGVQLREMKMYFHQNACMRMLSGSPTSSSSDTRKQLRRPWAKRGWRGAPDTGIPQSHARMGGPANTHSVADE